MENKKSPQLPTESLSKLEVSADKASAHNSSDSEGKLQIVVAEKKRTQRKRRRKTKTGSDDEEEQIDLALEEKLQECAKRNKLNPIEIKKILRKIVANDHVLALVKLQEEEELAKEKEKMPESLEKPANEKTDNSNPLKCSPKITRSRASQAQGKPKEDAEEDAKTENAKCIPKLTRSKTRALNLPTLPITPLSQPEIEPEIKALITEELHSDEEDEEYEPREEDFGSDEDPNTTISDLDSQPCTPMTPIQPHEAEGSPRVAYSKDGIFKVPRNRTESGTSQQEEIIAKRTRSKLCLQTTPIEAIESTFVPPDIPRDMYDLDVEMDQAWIDFLKGFSKPMNVNTEEDDEADPEYVAVDQEPIDREELREELREVNIPRKELKDLISELGITDDENTANDLNLLSGIESLFDDYSCPIDIMPSRNDGIINTQQNNSIFSPDIMSTPQPSNNNQTNFRQNNLHTTGMQSMNANIQQTISCDTNSTSNSMSVLKVTESSINTTQQELQSSQNSEIPPGKNASVSQSVASQYDSISQPTQMSTQNESYIQPSQTQPYLPQQPPQPYTQYVAPTQAAGTWNTPPNPSQHAIQPTVQLQQYNLVHSYSGFDSALPPTVLSEHEGSTNFLLYRKDKQGTESMLKDITNPTYQISRTQPNVPELLRSSKSCEVFRLGTRKAIRRELRELYRKKFEDLKYEKPIEYNFGETQEGFTYHQKQILDQQMRMHVQFALQNFMQTFCHPQLWALAEQPKGMLLELEEKSKGNENSAFKACNLKPALEFVREWEEELSVCNEENTEYVEFMQYEVDTMMIRRKHNLLYTPKFHPRIMTKVISSEAFIYPELLPKIPFIMQSPIAMPEFAPAEDYLIALGMEKAYNALAKRPRGRGKVIKVGVLGLSLKLIAERISRDFLQIRKSVTRLYHHMINQIIDVEYNPIKFFMDHNKPPPFYHHVQPLDFKNIVPPKERLQELPAIWWDFVNTLKFGKPKKAGKGRKPRKYPNPLEQHKDPSESVPSVSAPTACSATNIIFHVNYICDKVSEAPRIDVSRALESRETFEENIESIDTGVTTKDNQSQSFSYVYSKRNNWRPNLQLSNNTPCIHSPSSLSNSNYNLSKDRYRGDYYNETSITEIPKGQKLVTEYFTSIPAKSGSLNHSDEVICAEERTPKKFVRENCQKDTTSYENFSDVEDIGEYLLISENESAAKTTKSPRLILQKITPENGKRVIDNSIEKSVANEQNSSTEYRTKNTNLTTENNCIKKTPKRNLEKEFHEVLSIQVSTDVPENATSNQPVSLKDILGNKSQEKSHKKATNRSFTSNYRYFKRKKDIIEKVRRKKKILHLERRNFKNFLSRNNKKIAKSIKHKHNLKRKFQVLYFAYRVHLWAICSRFENRILRHIFTQLKSLELYTKLLVKMSSVKKSKDTEASCSDESASSKKPKLPCDNPRNKHLKKVREQIKRMLHSDTRGEMNYKDAVFALNFFDRVEDIFTKDGKKESFTKFQKILKNFDPQRDRVADLYFKMENLFLPDHPELAEVFLTFLLPGEAIQVGKFFEHFMVTNMGTFIDKLNVYFEKQPGHIKQIYACLEELSKDTELTMEKVKAKILPMIKGNKFLVDWFLQMFSSERPPESLLTDYETVQINNNDLIVDEFETLSYKDLMPDTSEYQSCQIKYLNGRIFYGSRIVLPTRLSFLARNLTKSEEIRLNPAKDDRKLGIENKCVHSIRQYAEKVMHNIPDEENLEDLGDSGGKKGVKNKGYELCDDNTFKAHAARLNPSLYSQFTSDALTNERQASPKKTSRERRRSPKKNLSKSPGGKRGSNQQTDAETNRSRKLRRLKESSLHDTRTKRRKIQETPCIEDEPSTSKAEEPMSSVEISSTSDLTNPAPTSSNLPENPSGTSTPHSDASIVVVKTTNWTREEDKIILETVKYGFESEAEFIESLMLQLPHRSSNEISQRHKFLMEVLSQLKGKS